MTKKKLEIKLEKLKLLKGDTCVYFKHPVYYPQNNELGIRKWIINIADCLYKYI